MNWYINMFENLRIETRMGITRKNFTFIPNSGIAPIATENITTENRKTVK